MRRIVLPLLLVLFGCGPQAEQDENVTLLNLMAIGTQTGLERCAPGQDLRECVDLSEPKRMTGIWVAGFEISRFQAQGSKEASYFEPTIQMARQRKSGREWRSYAVEFVGRSSMVVGQFGNPPDYDSLVVADRMISMKEVSQP